MLHAVEISAYCVLEERIVFLLLQSSISYKVERQGCLKTLAY